jgi:Ycf66 protein N-terminus
MVNFGLNSASILGIILAVAGASLYFLRSVRPELSRDHDIFFAAIGLLCGFILLFQGWRLDPILQFGQFLLSGSAVFFAWESIKLRGVTTEQAKRGGNVPMTDDDIPVSRPQTRAKTRVYRSEYDELEPAQERPRRRIRGTQENSRSSRNPRYDDYDEPEETPPRRGNIDRFTNSEPPVNRKRGNRPNPRFEESEEPREMEDNWEEQPRPRRKRPPVDPVESEPTPKVRRNRNSGDNPTSRRKRDDVTPADYVEYKPADYSEPEDNSEFT